MGLTNTFTYAKLNYMKAHLRIPTKETYAYIELEVYADLDQIIDIYLEATKKYKDKQAQIEKDAPPFNLNK